MFTGIIEEIGKVTKIQKGKESARLSIQGDLIFEDMKMGDSIAVNGLCLTVCDFKNKTFSADVMGESLDRSGLGSLKIGRRVNLERAMPANGRFGGHMVSGHIDGTGIITSQQERDNAILIRVKTSRKIMRYIVEKGSITIDGISLTVATIETEHFTVSIIPHTAKSTTLLERKTGDMVNLENDMVGKYIERFLMDEKIPETNQGKITMGFLEKNGF